MKRKSCKLLFIPQIKTIIIKNVCKHSHEGKCLCLCILAFVFTPAVQLIYAVHHGFPGTARAQMLLTPSVLGYSSFVRFPLGVLLFNQAFDPVLRDSFSCETRPCHSQLTMHILNGARCLMTNSFFMYTRRI